MKGNDMRKLILFGSTLLVATALLGTSASGQGFPELDLLTTYANQSFLPGTAPPQPQQGGSSNNPAPQPALAPDSKAPQNPGPNAITIMRGTHVLMALTSPLHSTSGTAGSGVYLEVVAPVVQQDRVVIPAHTYVQGTVEGNRRPGHFNRGSEFRIRFTTMVFPNNSVATIDGVLQSVPGSKTVRSQDREGTVRTVDQTEKVLLPGAASSVGGAILGSVSRFGVGTLVGAGLGAGLGMGKVLLQRGNEISLPLGTHMEMVLRSETMLRAEQMKFNAEYIAPPPTVFRAPQPESSTPVRDWKRQHRNDPALLWPILGALLLR